MNIQHSEFEIHRAGFVAADANNVFENGYILTNYGVVKEVGSYTKHLKIQKADVIEHGSGIILPSLVNVHTHLELCALKGKIPYNLGFAAWVKELLRQRLDIPFQNLMLAAQDGIDELLNAGSMICGEISTLGITKKMFLNSALKGIWFNEILGQFAEISERGSEDIRQRTDGKFVSYAGHAPHTTSPKLLCSLKDMAKIIDKPFSIHLSESEEEVSFLKTAKGKWAKFLTQRQIDFSNWGLPAKSPVQHLERLGLLDSGTIAVHMLFGDKIDYEILAEHNVPVCLCSRSNKNLHKKLPDVTTMIKAGIKLCLGTDSLASVDSLSIFEEMAFMSNSFPNIRPEKIIEMATINGATALGISDKFGTVASGKKKAFVYVSVKASTASSAMESVVNKDFSKPCKLIL